jgi:mitochondrial fission 1 protein
MSTIILEECISDEELKKYRDIYNSKSTHTDDDEFQLALNLVRCKTKTLVQEGLSRFQTLFIQTQVEDIKRDTLYYMAVAEAKLNNYEQSLKYLQSILNIQPSNEQVRDLYIEINKRMKRDGLIGIGIVGSAALVGVVGLRGLGAALLTKK